MGRRTGITIMSDLLDKSIAENRALQSKLDKANKEIKILRESNEEDGRYLLDAVLQLYKVTAQRKALAISCKNIIRGGVDALKESQRANKKLIDHANNLAADAVEGILGQK